MPDTKPDGANAKRQGSWGIRWEVFVDVFWRDVIYAILPLVVSFIITAVKGGDFFHLFQSAEWLFAAIVFLGLSIAHLDRRREAATVVRSKPFRTAPLLFLVIIAAVLLGLSLWQRQSSPGGTSNGTTESGKWLLPVAQLSIALYALYRLWKLAYQEKLEEVRWKDSLCRTPPQLPNDMQLEELIGNLRKNLNVARAEMALLGRAVSAEKKVAEIAARDPEAWNTAANDLQAEIQGFIKLSEMLERSLAKQGNPGGGG
jgi:hypothetical protein